MGIRKSTQSKYWSIYEAHLKYASIQEIMLQFDCDRTTVWRAIQYWQSRKLELSAPEELEVIIEAKRLRIRRMFKRLDFLEAGWSEGKVVQKDGVVFATQVKGKFSPAAEAALYREIRELENDIAGLKGLYESKTGQSYFEDTSEDVDYESIQEAIDSLEDEKPIQ